MVAPFERRAKSATMRVRQVTQQDVAEVDFLHLLIVTPQAEVLTFKGLPDKATMVEPLDISLGIDQANLKFGTIFEQPDWTVFELGSQIDFGRSFHVQGFMGSLFIKAFEPLLGAALLSL